MLRKFSVTNYKNFRDTVCIDFTDTRKYDFNTECIKNGLINKAAILGRNGIGKTNLGLALFDISYTLTDNLSSELQTNEAVFLNGFSSSKYATFVYEFQQNEKILRYEYRKNSPFNIIYESLHVDEKKIFERNGQMPADYSGLEELNLETLQIKITNGPLAVLRFIYNNTVPKEGSPIAFIMDFVSRMLYFRSVEGNQFIGFMNRGEIIESYLMSNDLVDEFQQFLHDNAELDVDLKIARSKGMEDVLAQKFKNRLVPFRPVSSSGTKALLLFFYWMKHFSNVSFLYMDEFDAFYHYELAENIVRLVIGMDSFQTLFTTHNTDLVDNNLMRPDCYLILTETGLKSLPERTVRELREGHNLRKLLRGGEFDG